MQRVAIQLTLIGCLAASVGACSLFESQASKDAAIEQEWGLYPTNFKDVIPPYFAHLLKDPKSAKYTYDEPTRFDADTIKGWRICGELDPDGTGKRTTNYFVVMRGQGILTGQQSVPNLTCRDKTYKALPLNAPTPDAPITTENAPKLPEDIGPVDYDLPN